jgi:protein kinase-like protein
MTPDQWQRVRSIFEAAVDRDPADVAAWLDEQRLDRDVRDEVLSLLAHHSRAGEFLSEPIVDRVPDLLADDEALPDGAHVGAYTIVREVGRGGMGRVYLATDARLGRTVALKALAPHLLRDPVQRERLRREARAAAALSHPGICTVYALEEIDGEVYIATEYLDGITLGEEIRRRATLPPPADVARTARELAGALAAAHAAGIVHRDLKPDNVMRTRDGRLKILDFGLARSQAGAASFATRPGLLIGTPGYIAPEQLAGERGDARADVYAFGVLLYEYACGTHPFVTGAPRTVPAVGAVVQRCLRPAPDDRFASAIEIASALDGSAGAAPAMAHAAWWRTHQAAIVAMYAVGAAGAWQIKDWFETPLTVAIFIALGALATIGGVFRGHLLFTERMSPLHLAVERGRVVRPLLTVDLLFSTLLVVDGVLMAQARALPAVLAISIGLGVALAALVLEPATTRAAFGGADDRD